jgi:hypothetical protein
MVTRTPPMMRQNSWFTELNFEEAIRMGAATAGGTLESCQGSFVNRSDGLPGPSGLRNPQLPNPGLFPLIPGEPEFTETYPLPLSCVEK